MLLVQPSETVDRHYSAALVNSSKIDRVRDVVHGKYLTLVTKSTIESQSMGAPHGPPVQTTPAA